MRQMRKISNLIAEGLADAGLDENDSLFERKVDAISRLVAECIDEAAKGKKCENCNEEDDGDAGFVDYDEEDEAADLFYVTDDTTLSGINLTAGQYVEVYDYGDDSATVSILDEDGGTVAVSVTVDADELSDFIENHAEEIEFDDEGALVGEAVSKFRFRNGKKVKVDRQVAMKNQKAAGKKYFFKRTKDGKIVKIKKTQKMIKKWAKAAKKNFKGAARKKAQKFAAKSRKVNSGFDIQSSGMKVALQEGDEIIFNEDSTIDVIREGSKIVSGISVSESFFDRCVSEGVIEDNDSEDVEEKTDEAAILTYENGRGYVVVKEGSKIALGNRMRARAFLTNEGYTFSSKELDDAAEGNLVTL